MEWLWRLVNKCKIRLNEKAGHTNALSILSILEGNSWSCQVLYHFFRGGGTLLSGGRQKSAGDFANGAKPVAPNGRLQSFALSSRPGILLSFSFWLLGTLDCDAQRPYGISGIKPRSVVCEARVLPTVPTAPAPGKLIFWLIRAS